MPEGVRALWEYDTESLADEFGICVDRSESAAVTDTANEFLSTVDEVYDVPISSPTREGEPAGREWAEPGRNPYNAISYRCLVSPPSDARASLAGFSVGIKDNIAVGGVPMSIGSSVMRGNVPASDATVVRRILAAGGSVIAKTNLDEFAGGGRSKSFTGRITNPHDVDRIAGGSSGGSAVAVATGAVDVALGTDTGGSVRMPASFCGVVGMKPTYGLVPLAGVIENTYTLDHVGPIAETVADAAAVLEAIAGKDPGDTASMAAAGRDDYRIGGYTGAVESAPDPADISLGILQQGFGNSLEKRVADRVRGAIDRFVDAGAGTHDVSVRNFDGARPIKNVISYSELADFWRSRGAAYRRGTTPVEFEQTNFARHASGSSAELNPFYRSRIVAGAQLVAGHHGRYYSRAMEARETLQSQLDDALDSVDAVVLPTMTHLPPLVDEADEPGFEYTRNTRLANLTGHPAITVPAGEVDGLPVGLQFVARRFEEDRLVAVASRFESVSGGGDSGRKGTGG